MAVPMMQNCSWPRSPSQSCVTQSNPVTAYRIHRGSWYFACMSRLARMVVPGLPHHVTQRGNRREAIFFEDGDQQLYCDMLGEQLRKFRVEVWAYCLMPNHVHLILTPQIEQTA
jgi:hypothetical protein